MFFQWTYLGHDSMHNQHGDKGTHILPESEADCWHIINYKNRVGIQITHRYREGNQVADFLVAFFILRTQVENNTSVPTILKHRGTTTYRSLRQNELVHKRNWGDTGLSEVCQCGYKCVPSDPILPSPPITRDCHLRCSHEESKQTSTDWYSGQKLNLDLK